MATTTTFEAVRLEFLKGIITLEQAATISGMKPDEFLYHLAIYNARMAKKFEKAVAKKG